MKLADDPETVSWLEGLTGGSGDFDWDEGNRAKNRKHGVEMQDAEAMLDFPLVFAGRIVEPSHEESRYLALGQDRRGRHLALIFTRRGTRLRPICCRPMRRGERNIYEEAIGVAREEEGL